MPLWLGIDTSNYTTSAALYDGRGIVQSKRLLPVEPGKIGLRQSDAVFAHVKQLGDVLENVLAGAGEPVEAVGVSVSPRDEAGSYMPCFLVGELCARSIALTLRRPLYRLSHQAGHISAALYSADCLSWIHSPFLAFHVSGGTTQCLRVTPDPERILRMESVAETLDLNAGQAVDRVGALLGLPFPAGPALEELAARSEKKYPVRPALKGRDCCLSGLENLCRKRLEDGENRVDVAKYCLDYLEQALLEMTRRVCTAYPGLPLLYAGGVMSNKQIRSGIRREFDSRFAEPSFSADNAAGAAVLCRLHWKREGEADCMS